MKKTLGLAFVLALAATPAMAQKVTIDYAHDYDFGTVKTFKYVDTLDSNIEGNQMMADRIATMIVKELREGGLIEVQENPDIHVTYHYVAEDRTNFSTTNYGYGGYWGGWYGWGGPGMGTSTTHSYNYTEGTLIIDAFDAAEKKMIWRGSGTVTVKAKPEKQVKQVENILNKLGNKWDKILAGKGK
jgi:hypothetical protein